MEHKFSPPLFSRFVRALGYNRRVMSIKFLNIPAEKAVLALSRIIEQGYEIKIGMDTEYARAKKTKGGVDSSVHVLVDKWEKQANEWFTKAIKKLSKIYASKRMAYEFQEAQSGIGFGSSDDDPEWRTINRAMRAKLDKLNQFDDFIKREFRVEIEYIAGDKFEHHGKGNQTKTSAG